MTLVMMLLPTMTMMTKTTKLSQNVTRMVNGDNDIINDGHAVAADDDDDEDDDEDDEDDDDDEDDEDDDDDVAIQTALFIRFRIYVIF